MKTEIVLLWHLLLIARMSLMLVRYMRDSNDYLVTAQKEVPFGEATQES